MTVLSFAALLASLYIVAAPFAGAVDSAAPTSTVRIPLTTVAGQAPLTLEATLHKPAGNGPFPVVLYSHGAAGDPRLYKVTVKVQDFADALASRGVAVLAVMRVGRGASDGVYEEEPSACTVDAARAGIASASRSVDASIAWLRTQTWVKTDQIVLAGHSRGGILSTVYAAEHPGLVRGVINFSGGWKNANCASPDINLVIFKSTASKPMPPQLFVYARGDFYYPVASVESYAQAARGNDGDLTFELYDKPNGFDGHQLFSKAFPIVRPTVEQFLSKLGLAKPVGM